MNEASRLRLEFLHSLELPVAQLTSLMANVNRDAKKQRKPYAMEDFCFFIDREALKPEAQAASAYRRLLDDGLLPPWALFCFADFKDATASKRPSAEVAILGDGWILLAPIEIDGGFQGLLVAEQRVAGQTLQGAFMDEQVEVELPAFQEFVLAKAGVHLPEPRRLPSPVQPFA